MSTRVDASDSAILQALVDIKQANGYTRWILLDYVAKSDNKLKLVDTGTGGLEELSEYLNDGKILYFLVWFEINNVRKFAYISWCGEGVTGMKKGLFNNHAQDVANLFKGFHAQFNARSEKDVKEKLIIEKLTKATGAAYDSGAKVQGSAKLVPQSVAQGRQQASQSNAKVRTFEKTSGTDQSTENRPSQSSITYESRALDQSTESKPAPSSIRYENRGHDQSTESTPVASTLPGTRGNASGPPVKGSASSFKSKFEQQASAPSNAPSRPAPGKLTSAPPPPRPAPVQAAPPPKVAEPEPEPEPEPAQEEPYQEEPYQEEPYQEEPYQEETYNQESYEPQAAEEAPFEEQPAEQYGGGDYSQEQQSGSVGVAAKALYDYDAENPDDLSFKEGDVINVLDQSDPSGWWEGELNGKTGFFPSNFVELA